MADNSEEIYYAKLCAYVEGELDPRERADLEKHLQSHPQHRRILAELTQTRQLLQALPREPAPPDLAEAFQGQLERTALLGDGGTAEEPYPTYRTTGWTQYFAAAAIVMLAAGLGVIVYFALPKSGAQLDNVSYGPSAAQVPVDDTARPTFPTHSTATTQAAPVTAGKKDSTKEAAGPDAPPDPATASTPAGPASAVAEAALAPRDGGGAGGGGTPPSTAGSDARPESVGPGAPKEAEADGLPRADADAGAADAAAPDVPGADDAADAAPQTALEQLDTAADRGQGGQVSGRSTLSAEGGGRPATVTGSEVMVVVSTADPDEATAEVAQYLRKIKAAWSPLDEAGTVAAMADDAAKVGPDREQGQFTQSRETRSEEKQKTEQVGGGAAGTGTGAGIAGPIGEAPPAVTEPAADGGAAVEDGEASDSSAGDEDATTGAATGGSAGAAAAAAAPRSRPAEAPRKSDQTPPPAPAAAGVAEEAGGQESNTTGRRRGRTGDGVAGGAGSGGTGRVRAAERTDRSEAARTGAATGPAVGETAGVNQTKIRQALAAGDRVIVARNITRREAAALSEVLRTYGVRQEAEERGGAARPAERRLPGAPDPTADAAAAPPSPAAEPGVANDATADTETGAPPIRGTGRPANAGAGGTPDAVRPGTPRPGDKMMRRQANGPPAARGGVNAPRGGPRATHPQGGAPQGQALTADVVRKGDVLHVQVSGLNGAGAPIDERAEVAEDGTVSLPGVDALRCDGLTVRQLEERVARRYQTSLAANDRSVRPRVRIAKAPATAAPGRADNGQIATATPPAADSATGSATRDTGGDDRRPAAARPPGGATATADAPAGGARAGGENQGAANEGSGAGAEDDRVDVLIVLRKDGSAALGDARADAAVPDAPAVAEQTDAPAATTPDDPPAARKAAKGAAPGDGRPVEQSEILVIVIKDARGTAAENVFNVRVGEDGTIEVPNVGKIRALGRTPAQLTRAVQTAYSRKAGGVDPETVTVLRPEDLPAPPVDDAAASDRAEPAKR